MILRLAAIFVIAGHCAFGQLSDSVAAPLTALDTVLQKGQSQLDSIRNDAASRFAILRSSYDSVATIADEQTARIQAAIDSAQQLNLPAGWLENRIDSIRQWKDEQIEALTDKVDQLRSRVTEKVDALGLPPALEGKGGELKMAMDELDVSIPEAELPDVLKNATGFELPTVDNSLNASFPGIEGADLGIAEEHIQGLEGRLSTVPANMEEAAALAEEQAAKLVEGSGAAKDLGSVEQLKQATVLPDEQAAKEAIEQEVRKQAIDHFQGKEEQLKKAMETLAKYKQKYSKLEGLDQIPKKRPNPMRGKTFMERMVPGIALQVHRKDAWMVDFNLYAGYHFSERLRAGAGWNQRVAYDADLYRFDPDLRVFGPRLFAEFETGRGFSARLESEYMNTRIPPQFASGQPDPDNRQWVYSTIAGIKKEYRFMGNVMGTMMLLYNLHDREHRSPYADKLMVRFGFEFSLKPRTKQANKD